MQKEQFTNSDHDRPILVLLPWLDRAMEGTIIGVLDVLKSINLLTKMKSPLATPPISWRFMGGDRVALPLELFSPSAAFDASNIPPSRRLLVLPVFHVGNSAQIGDLLLRYPAYRQIVKAHAVDGGTIVACGNGVVFVAEAGLLTGEQITSSWLHRRWFEEKYPRVDFSGSDPINRVDRIFVSVARDTQQACLLDALGHLLDAGMVHACRSLLSFDMGRQDQAHDLLSNNLIRKTTDTPAYKAVKWLERHLQQSLDMGKLAADISSSESTILRHFKDAYDMTPVQYLQKIRIDRAKVLLEITQQDISEIAEACGYQDAASLRRIFKKATGHTPGAYRTQYSLRAKTRKLWRTDPLSNDTSSGS